MAYAEPADLAPDYLDTVPPDAARLLRHASAEVDRALLTSIYDPTDPAVATALKAATLEQAAGEVAERSGGGGIASFTIGRINVTRSAGAGPTGSARVDGLHSRAWAVLQAAGLTGHEPWTHG